MKYLLVILSLFIQYAIVIRLSHLEKSNKEIWARIIVQKIRADKIQDEVETISRCY